MENSYIIILQVQTDIHVAEKTLRYFSSFSIYMYVYARCRVPLRKTARSSFRNGWSGTKLIQRRQTLYLRTIYCNEKNKNKKVAQTKEGWKTQNRRNEKGKGGSEQASKSTAASNVGPLSRLKPEVKSRSQKPPAKRQVPRKTQKA